MNNLKIIDVIWCNFNIGIVKCLDEITNETKFYIGVGKGYDEGEDISDIMDWGTKLSPEHLKSFIDN
jgi:hypothetical protein